LKKFSNISYKTSSCIISYPNFLASIVILGLQIYTLKREFKREEVLQFFYNITNDDAWQRKLIDDKQFIQDLLAVPDNEDIWDVFVNLAGNKGACTLVG
jgi:hypothetical protein